jgi:2-hydroxy-6-oxo-6-(2'-carboxyphenyl)-hexa-2,4-dienoate hydrolase
MGLSDKPAGPYDLAAMIRRLGGLLDHETRGPVVVVGHSMGGELAAALAIAHPERVVAAVLIAPAGYELGPALDSLTGRTADLIGWLNVAVGYVVPLHDPAWLGEPADRGAYEPMADPAYRAAATAVLRQFDFTALRDSFPRLRQPTLLLWGRQDPTIPWAVGERIAALLPCRTVVTFPGTLHRPHTTQPEAVLAEIRSFFRNPPACPSVQN